MINNLFKIFSIFILLYGCGFKVQNQSDLSRYYIKTINTSGDKRVNFNIKNKLFNKAGGINKKPIILTINTIKNKDIKEKNDRNIITKYLIKINLKVTVQIDDEITKEFNLTGESDFNVGSQYSQTIKNEKQAIKDITEKLINKIVREISIIE